MFFVNFFLIACIAALAAGDNYGWVPKTIPTASEQCKKAGNFQGVCGNNSPPHNAEICAKMLCAQFTSRNHEGIPIRVMTGTICGKSSVCQNYKCVSVPHDKFPKEIGEHRVHKCK